LVDCQAEFFGSGWDFGSLYCGRLSESLNTHYPISDLEIIAAITFSYYQTYVCQNTPEDCVSLQAVAMDRLIEIKQAITNIGTECSCNP
jgi:hypothetical protein